MSAAFYLWHSLTYLLETGKERIFENAVLEYDGDKFEAGYATESREECNERGQMAPVSSVFGHVNFCAQSDKFTYAFFSELDPPGFKRWVEYCFVSDAKIVKTYRGWVLNISSYERKSNYLHCLNQNLRAFHPRPFSFPKSVKYVYFIGHPDGLELFHEFSTRPQGINQKQLRTFGFLGNFTLPVCAFNMCDSYAQHSDRRYALPSQCVDPTKGNATGYLVLKPRFCIIMRAWTKGSRSGLFT